MKHLRRGASRLESLIRTANSREWRVRVSESDTISSDAGLAALVDACEVAAHTCTDRWLANRCAAALELFARGPEDAE